MPAISVIQHRRGTAANWTAVNPVLAAGELGFETDTGECKIGNGAGAWAALPYVGATGSGASIAAHAALTTGVHGAGASTLATVANIATHAGLTTGVHGVGGSTVAALSDVTTHAGLTTTAHGLGASAFHADAFFDAAGVGHTEATDHVSTHAALITGVHGLVITAGKTLTLTESLTLNALPIGGLAVATAANTLGSLAVGVAGQYLAGGGAGTVPSWGTLNQAAIAGLTTADGPSFAHLHLADVAAITTAAESWVGPSSTTGIYFVSGLSAVGTSVPLDMFTVRPPSGAGISGITVRTATGSADESAITILHPAAAGYGWRLRSLNSDGSLSLDRLSSGSWANGMLTVDMATANVAVAGNVITAAESWVGPSSTTGVYFKGGFVGVGTVVPGELLNVSKSQNLATRIMVDNTNTEAGSDAGLRLRAGNSTNDSYLFRNSNANTSWAGANSFNMVNVENAPIGLYTNSTAGNGVTILGNGNVGIGTTGPNARLDIGSGADTNARIRFSYNLDPTNYYSEIYYDPTGATEGMVFNLSGGSEWFAFTSGNVGIGTTAPGELLTIGAEGVGATPRQVIRINSGGYGAPGAFNTAGNGDKIILHDSAGTGYDARIGVGDIGDLWFKSSSNTADSGIFRFYTGSTPTERVRITGAGNLGISTVSPTNIISIGGNAARTVWTERGTVANTAGYNLTVKVGGATVGATDKNGGTLYLAGGLSTGTGTSSVILQTCPAGSTGTADNTPATMFEATGNKLGFWGVTAVVRPTALTAANAGALNTGDATSDTVIGNMRTRIGEIESKLQALGLLS